MKPARFVSITAPPDNDCADCAALNTRRAFCPAHRPVSAPCWWCGGRGFRVVPGRLPGESCRWARCNGSDT